MEDANKGVRRGDHAGHSIFTARPHERYRDKNFALERSLSSLDAMSDSDESAKLWKVNRTIHELVKDRVSAQMMAYGVTGPSAGGIAGIPSLRR